MEKKRVDTSSDNSTIGKIADADSIDERNEILGLCPRTCNSKHCTFQFVDFLLQVRDVAFVLRSAVLSLSQTEYR